MSVRQSVPLGQGYRVLRTSVVPLKAAALPAALGAAAVAEVVVVVVAAAAAGVVGATAAATRWLALVLADCASDHERNTAMAAGFHVLMWMILMMLQQLLGMVRPQSRFRLYMDRGRSRRLPRRRQNLLQTMRHARRCPQWQRGGAALHRRRRCKSSS
jgi:hypothetical protein